FETETLSTLAYNMANVLRQLVLAKPIKGWTLTTLREKLVRLGAKAVSHANYVVFQLTEVAVPRQLFAAILERIGQLRPAEASSCVRSAPLGPIARVEPRRGVLCGSLSSRWGGGGSIFLGKMFAIAPSRR